MGRDIFRWVIIGQVMGGLPIRQQGAARGELMNQNARVASLVTHFHSVTSVVADHSRKSL